MNNVESTDAVEPATLILMGVDVELNVQLITNIDIEVAQTILAEDIEDHSVGIVFMSLQNKALDLPVISSTCRLAAAGFHRGNDFTL